MQAAPLFGFVSGRDYSLGQNIFASNDVVIGNNVKIQNNVSVYDAVRIEDDVFCGPSMVFTNVYNPRSAISRKDEYRETFVHRGATLGANCTIICGTTVGRHAFVAAGAVVNRAVCAYGWRSRKADRLDVRVRRAASKKDWRSHLRVLRAHLPH
ncbi:acyltransferase [Nitrobacter sp. JJSN]|uniref:acyltransferase n=1 Tax=Nitrobacter sp. JJSN TaxID=3453033 RepID=UPI003F7727FC